MSPNLVGLRAGETPRQRSAAGRQCGSEGGSAVCQEGLQVAEGSRLSRSDNILHEQMDQRRKEAETLKVGRMAPPGVRRQEASNPGYGGYLWSKLYQILKGQALSCLVFLRSEPSDTAKLCRGGKVLRPALRHLFKSSHLQRRPGQCPRQPCKTKAASEDCKAP